MTDVGARIDKTESAIGIQRGRLNADQAKTTAGNGVGVGINTSGRIVAGAGNTGIIGVVVLTKDKKAGDVVDILSLGELIGATELTAGTVITANTTSGALSTTAASATQVPIGYTIEADRIVVKAGQRQFDADTLPG